MVAGQIQQNNGNKTQVTKLNIGPRSEINLTTLTPDINTSTIGSWVRIRKQNGARAVIDTFTDGEEGDVLFIHGRNIRLQNGGNLRVQGGGFNMDGSDMVAFIQQPNGNWFELARKD